MNVTELKSYLGLLNYYNKSLPDQATLSAPLHELLDEMHAGSVVKKQEEAF